MRHGIWALAVLAVAAAVAQPSRSEIRTWLDANRIIVDEKLNGRNVTIRFFSIKRKDFAKLAQECVDIYKRFYDKEARYGSVGVWCYVYDNARALETDLRPVGTPGRTSGTCWIYRASVALSGDRRAEKNDPVILQVGNCPRP